MSESSETNQPVADEGAMSFWGHLEDLRKRIILSVAGIAVGCIISGTFIKELMNNILLRPAVVAQLPLQNLRPFGLAFLYFKVIFVVGAIIACPYVLYQVWRFIAPGLYQHERSWARKITFFTVLCFLTGVAFSYLVMVPGMLQFSANFVAPGVQNIIDINEYFSFVTTTILGAGLIFELPMITYVLARFGIMSSAFMVKYRRHAIIVILIIAAVLTPSPDPINQLIFAIPLWILYEISIIIAKFAYKKKEEVPETE